MRVYGLARPSLLRRLGAPVSRARVPGFACHTPGGSIPLSDHLMTSMLRRMSNPLTPLDRASFDPSYRAPVRRAVDQTQALRRRIDRLTERLEAVEGLDERLEPLEALAGRLEALVQRIEAVEASAGRTEKRMHVLEKPQRDAQAAQRLKHFVASRGW